MSSSKRKQPAELFVVSDGTGETAASAARAAMAQFEAVWRMRLFGEVRHESQVRRIVEEALRERALIVFTLVDQRIAELLRALAAEGGVPTVDLLGPLISRAAQQLGEEPRSLPGILHGFSSDSFRRVEAVEFAVRHDDGANLHTLFEADLVVTGVSRTSKTPISMYLAQRGYKVGNVPLVPGMEPFRELFEFDSRRVFGLVVDVATLVRVREARLRGLHVPPYRAYADPEAVVDELRRARRLCRERGWKVVDISGRAVEESAARILELYTREFPQG